MSAGEFTVHEAETVPGHSVRFRVTVGSTDVVFAADRNGYVSVESFVPGEPEPEQTLLAVRLGEDAE